MFWKLERKICNHFKHVPCSTYVVTETIQPEDFNTNLPAQASTLELKSSEGHMNLVSNFTPISRKG